MTVIVCLDRRNGMRFNNRRQSADRRVTERIVRMTESGGNVCFFETGDISAILKRTDKLIVFRWDKVYPADTMFPMEEMIKTFHLVSTESFPGYSHDVITQEVYVR